MTLSEAGKLADELFGRQSVVIFDPGKESIVGGEIHQSFNQYFILGMDYDNYTLRIKSEISWEHAFEIAKRVF